MDEFQLIADYFERAADAPGVTVGIGDDGAIVSVDSGQQVHVLDTLVQDIHFPANAGPADIAWRAVAVNLSDIAAMGAEPQWMTLGLTLPNVGERWIREFSEGLFDIADSYGVQLIGGDTTRGPVVVVTVAMTGTLPGEPLLRSGARAGDAIYVTGNLGDAAGGLASYEAGESSPDLLRRFLRPTPRLIEGRALVGRASAAIDVSDGLAADLAKLLSASGVGGEVRIEDLPISEQLQDLCGDKRSEELALTGGDDYELCFTGPAGLDSLGSSRIGTVTDSGELVFTRDGEIVDVDTGGYRHFS